MVWPEIAITDCDSHSASQCGLVRSKKQERKQRTKSRSEEIENEEQNWPEVWPVTEPETWPQDFGHCVRECALWCGSTTIVELNKMHRQTRSSISVLHYMMLWMRARGVWAWRACRIRWVLWIERWKFLSAFDSMPFKLKVSMLFDSGHRICKREFWFTISTIRRILLHWPIRARLGSL